MDSGEFIYALGIVEIGCHGLMIGPAEAFEGELHWTTSGLWDPKYSFLWRIMHPNPQSFH
jgi:hypothetical protein